MDSSIISIFNNIKLPIIIWDKGFCIYSNTHIINKGDTIDMYMRKNYISNYELYVEYVNHNKDNIKLKNYKDHINLEYLSDNSYLEIHYPSYLENELLGIIIYKLRKSLTNIVSYIQPENNEKNTEVTAIIKQSCQTIMSLTNDLIDILNIQKNKLSITFEMVYLEELLQYCTNYIFSDIAVKGLRLNKYINPNLKFKLKLDASKVKQIILNLLDNALKFTMIGGIFINIDEYNPKDHKIVIPDLPGNPNICIMIKDTGIGMSEDVKSDLNILLNVPTQDICIHSKRTRLKGFGLYICYHLCKFLNGHIWFKSEKDVGTVFYVVIPCFSN